jgi:hypothetical protein
MEQQRIEVQRAIAAEPAAIFAVLRDPQGHVAIDASGMLMWAEGEPVSGVGDRFVVHMDRDSLRDFDLGEYDVDVVISAFETDREIAWTVDGVTQPPIGHVYGYRLEPVEGGTMVTSYYDWSNLHEKYRSIAADLFPVISEKSLLGSLGILARTVAPRAGRPGAKRTAKGQPVLDEEPRTST